MTFNLILGVFCVAITYLTFRKLHLIDPGVSPFALPKCWKRFLRIVRQ